MALVLLLSWLAPGTAADQPHEDVASWILAEGGSLERDDGHIVSVDLASCWITDADLEKLSRLPRLQEINLAHTWISYNDEMWGGRWLVNSDAHGVRVRIRVTVHGDESMFDRVPQFANISRPVVVHHALSRVTRAACSDQTITSAPACAACRLRSARLPGKVRGIET